MKIITPSTAAALLHEWLVWLLLLALLSSQLPSTAFAVSGEVPGATYRLQQGWRLWTAKTLEENRAARYPQLQNGQLSNWSRRAFSEVLEELKATAEFSDPKARQTTSRNTPLLLGESGKATSKESELAQRLNHISEIWQRFGAITAKEQGIKTVDAQGPKRTHPLQTLMSISDFVTTYLSENQQTTQANGQRALSQNASGDANGNATGLGQRSLDTATAQQFIQARDLAAKLGVKLGQAHQFMLFQMSQFFNAGLLQDPKRFLNIDGSIDLTEFRRGLMEITRPSADAVAHGAWTLSDHVAAGKQIVTAGGPQDARQEKILEQAQRVVEADRMLQHWKVVQEAFAMAEVVNPRLQPNQDWVQSGKINAGENYMRVKNGRHLGGKIFEQFKGPSISRGLEQIIRSRGFFTAENFMMQAAKFRANVVGSLQFVGILALANLFYSGTGLIPGSYNSFTEIFKSPSQTLFFVGTLVGFGYVSQLAVHSRFLGSSAWMKDLMLDARAMQSAWYLNGVGGQAARSAAAAKGITQTEFLANVLGEYSATKGIAGTALLNGFGLASAMIVINTVSTTATHPHFNSVNWLFKNGYSTEAWALIANICQETVFNASFLPTTAATAALFVIPSVTLELFAARHFYSAGMLGMPWGVQMMISQFVFTLAVYAIHKLVLPTVMEQRNFVTPLEQKKAEYEEIVAKLTQGSQLRDDWHGVLAELGLSDMFSSETESMEIELLRNLIEGRLDQFDFNLQALFTSNHAQEVQAGVGDPLRQASDNATANPDNAAQPQTLEEYQQAEVAKSMEFMEQISKNLTALDAKKPEVLRSTNGLDTFKQLYVAHQSLNKVWLDRHVTVLIAAQQAKEKAEAKSTASQNAAVTENTVAADEEINPLNNYANYQKLRQEFAKTLGDALVRHDDKDNGYATVSQYPKTNQFLEAITSYIVAADLVDSYYQNYRFALGLGEISQIELDAGKKSQAVKDKYRLLSSKSGNFYIMGDNESEYDFNCRILKLLKSIFAAKTPQERDYAKQYPEAAMALMGDNPLSDSETSSYWDNPSLDPSQNNPLFDSVILPELQKVVEYAQAAKDSKALITWRDVLSDPQYEIYFYQPDEMGQTPISWLPFNLWSHSGAQVEAKQYKELDSISQASWEQLKGVSHKVLAYDDAEQAELRNQILAYDIHINDETGLKEASDQHLYCSHAPHAFNVGQHIADGADDVSVNFWHNLTGGLANPSETWSSLFTSNIKYWEMQWRDYTDAVRNGVRKGTVDDPASWIAYDQRQRFYKIYQNALAGSFKIRRMMEIGLIAGGTEDINWNMAMSAYQLSQIDIIDPHHQSPLLQSLTRNLLQAQSAQQDLDHPERSAKPKTPSLGDLLQQFGINQDGSIFFDDPSADQSDNPYEINSESGDVDGMLDDFGYGDLDDLGYGGETPVTPLPEDATVPDDGQSEANADAADPSSAGGSQSGGQ